MRTALFRWSICSGARWSISSGAGWSICSGARWSISPAHAIITPESAENFKSVFLTIVNKDGGEIKFMTSTEFLNFMSGHGYEMVAQIPNEYGGDYTFKKK